tara:strand:- start:1310 stop:2284 length:975 start_codon:yes stop_codon:yes gene_type:complete
MNKLIAITIGDINGIGIEILIKTWKEKKIKNFILITNIDILNKILKKRNYKLLLNLVNYKKNKFIYQKEKFNIFSYKASSLEDNTYKSLKHGYDLCANNKCIGVITLPLRKDLIKNKINKNFIGHTEFFQKKDKKNNVNMILFHKKIIISPLTTHIEVKKISKFVSNKEFLFNQIYNLNKCLKIDFNIKKPKLVISGLNPHAGENGKLGTEEKQIIQPIIKKLQKYNINISGPFSADSLLIKKNIDNFDCFIFIYHDQALIPFKFISQFSGVNYTGNLNIIRTSPDHGTAYNLLGSSSISNKSFINSYKLINKIYNNKKLNGKT